MNKQGPADSGRAVYLPLNCLKEFRLTAGKELIPKITFYQRDLAMWYGKHLFIKHLLFSSSCELPSSHLKPQTLTPSSQLRVAYKPQLPEYLWGSDMHEICFSSVNLLYVNLIIRPARKEEGKSFPSLHRNIPSLLKFNNFIREPVVIQWLGLSTLTARGPRFNPWSGN